ncbi:MAG: putative bifunctional diguanylate cyclase/phosphodiesterase, partial [Hyphomicrobiales bacterium]
LDHFKDVNDTLGHPVGDVLLRQVAERLNKIVRKSDLIARFGGDEFAVLQTDAVDVTATNTLARKIIEMLAIPFAIEENEVQITASMGISLYSAQLSGPDAIMIQADLALYRAKADGRNCLRFHSGDLDEEVQERVTIAGELRVALDRGEFELHYQPQVELASGRIVGLEALIRWKHPKRGLVMPSKFIAIAERSGAIVPIGRWAFDQACRQMRLWLDEGIAPETVAVNCSAIQFRKQPDLERDIAASLKNSGVASDRMEIELTESVLMEVTQQHRDALKRLRELGARIAIDDFGTGYSSLSYLTNYPANRLKIAQELMVGVDSNARSATVARAAIQIARELGIEIIAEGVETKAQVNFLISAGCTLGQGYLFGRPVSAKWAGRLLRRGTIEAATSQKRSENLAAA